MAPTYERTFVVAAPIERAWQAFTEPEQLEAWGTKPPRPTADGKLGSSTIEGLPPNEIEIVAAERPHRLHWRENRRNKPLGTIDMTVVFEEAGSGTRITITRSGFGDSEEWLLLAQASGTGWDEGIADLILYLETGVPPERHLTWRSNVGAAYLETGGGLRVAAVIPGGYAAEAGLRRDDILLTLGPVPIYHRSDVWGIERGHEPGEVLEVVYVRDGKLLRGMGRLSPKNFTEHALEKVR